MFSMHLRPEVLERLREQYPKGTRVELIEMCDPYREMPPGLKGTVQMVDDASGIQIQWDNGSTLEAIHGIDKIRAIKPFIIHRALSARMALFLYIEEVNHERLV